MSSWFIPLKLRHLSPLIYNSVIDITAANCVISVHSFETRPSVHSFKTAIVVNSLETRIGALI